MTDTTNNRVLCRRGARELTVDETTVVSAAVFNTRFCTAAAFAALTGTTTGLGDGDGCTDTDTDHI